MHICLQPCINLLYNIITCWNASNNIRLILLIYHRSDPCMCHSNNSFYRVSEIVISLYFFAAPDTPVDANISCTYHCETTMIIALGSGLSILFILLIVVIIIAIFIFVGSKKKPPRESDVYYDTINTAHPPPIIETELNIAYGNPKN